MDAWQLTSQQLTTNRPIEDGRHVISFDDIGDCLEWFWVRREDCGDLLKDSTMSGLSWRFSSDGQTRPGPFKKKPTKKRRKARRQPTQPQPPPRKTAPPTIDTTPAPTPATISFQRLELTKTPAPTPTSTVQRPPTPPVKARKQTRRTAPILTSSPIAFQPE